MESDEGKDGWGGDRAMWKRGREGRVERGCLYPERIE